MARLLNNNYLRSISGSYLSPDIFLSVTRERKKGAEAVSGQFLLKTTRNKNWGWDVEEEEVEVDVEVEAEVEVVLLSENGTPRKFLTTLVVTEMVELLTMDRDDLSSNLALNQD